MSQNQNICKICHVGDTDEEKLCYPCKCSGSIKYVHKNCLFMYIKTSNKNFCSICRFKYVFKDIYKENTPKYLPLTLLIKESACCVLKYLKLLVKTLVLMFIISSILITNSFMVFEIYGISFKEFLEFNLYFSGFVGIFVSMLSFLIYYLYFNISRTIRIRAQRRNLRIDSLNVMSSMASDVMSSTESHHTILSSIALNRDLSFTSNGNVNSSILSMREGINSPILNRNMNSQSSFNQEINLNVGFRDESATNMMIDDNYDDVSSDESEITSRSEMTEIVFDYKLFPKCCNVIFLISLFSKVMNRINYDFPSSIFTTFLKEVFLYDFTRDIVLFYALFFATVLAVYRYKIIYDFLKLLNLLFLCFAIIIYIDGIVIHFMFSYLINQGSVIDFSTYHLRSLYSFMFHMMLGYLFNSFLKNTIWMYKEKFRDGVVWPLADPDSGSFDFLYKLSRKSLFTTYYKVFRNSIIHIGVYAILLNLLKAEINRKLCIKDLTKLFIILKLVNMLSSTFDSTLLAIVNINHGMIRFCSRLVKMNNFLYNEDISSEDFFRDRLRWLPNKNKFYDVDSVGKRYERKVSREDVEKYFCKNNSRDYSVFYVPERFVFYFGAMMFIITFNTSLILKLIFRCTKLITDYLIQRYIFLANYDDYLFISVFGFVMFFTLSIPGSLKIISHLKSAIFYLYLNIVWPIWGTFLLIVLYGNDSMNIIPSSMFVRLFATSDILRYFLLKFLFEISVTNYSFRSIVRRLYSFTATTTLLFCTVRYLKSWLEFGIGSTADIPFLYLFVMIVIFLYFNGYLYRRFRNFVDSIRREHYLVDREIINYD
jgi:E3 ubiquitin-protein ligase MARCH6